MRLAIAYLALAFMLGGCSSPAPDPHIAYCRQLLDHLVKAPSTVKVISSGSAMEDYHLIYDANNDFGTPIRGRIDCWYKSGEKASERPELVKVLLDFNEVSRLQLLTATMAVLTEGGPGQNLPTLASSTPEPETSPQGSPATTGNLSGTADGWHEDEPTATMDSSKGAVLSLQSSNEIIEGPSLHLTHAA